MGPLLAEDCLSLVVNEGQRAVPLLSFSRPPDRTRPTAKAMPSVAGVLNAVLHNKPRPASFLAPLPPQPREHVHLPWRCPHRACIYGQRGHRFERYEARAEDCAACQQRDGCLRNPKATRGRQVARFQPRRRSADDPGQRMREAIDSAEGRPRDGGRATRPVETHLRTQSRAGLAASVVEFIHGECIVNSLLKIVASMALGLCVYMGAIEPSSALTTQHGAICQQQGGPLVGAGPNVNGFTNSTSSGVNVVCPIVRVSQPPAGGLTVWIDGYAGNQPTFCTLYSYNYYNTGGPIGSVSTTINSGYFDVLLTLPQSQVPFYSSQVLWCFLAPGGNIKDIEPESSVN